MGSDVESGKKNPASVKIPVGELAKQNLEAIFPHVTPEQAKALREGTPIPPSPDWHGYADLARLTDSVNGAADRIGQELGKLPVPTNPNDAEQIRLLKADNETVRVELAERTRDAGILDAFVAAGMKNHPTVSCVLCVSDPRRVRMARRAVNQFFAQTYPNKQLVIANASGTPVTTVKHPTIIEAPCNPGPLEALRSVAFALAKGSYVYPTWDDDDVYDRHLLAYQMYFAHRPIHGGHGAASMLACQVRVDISHTAAYMHHEPEGIPNTLITPRYFLDRFYAEDGTAVPPDPEDPPLVIDNTAFPVNTLKMCVYHGNNARTREQFMGRYAADDMRGRIALGRFEAGHMTAVLATFGVKTAPREHQDVTELQQ